MLDDLDRLNLQSLPDDISIILNAHNIPYHLAFFYARFFVVAFIEWFSILKENIRGEILKFCKVKVIKTMVLLLLFWWQSRITFHTTRSFISYQEVSVVVGRYVILTPLLTGSPRGGEPGVGSAGVRVARLVLNQLVF